MDIQLVASTNRLKDVKKMIDLSQKCGRVCYTEKDFLDVLKERADKGLQKRLIGSGHHSVFEHINFTFNFMGIPKALAMILNNEKQYATSEKSARYTIMKDMEPEQREKYDKWMDILIPKIDKIYPQMKNEDDRAKAIKKLAQENARYMTSVFTPTKMVHTINLRQLNYIQDEFEKILAGDTPLAEGRFWYRLIPSLESFLAQTEKWRFKGLENQTDRHISLFNQREVKNYFKDLYSTSYLMSFAGLAQAQRHRTINYNISSDIKLPSSNSEFFIPEVIPNSLREQWIDDLMEVSKYDFPQAQLVKVNERGTIEDFRSKAMLRLCGHAQHEIMKNTLKTAKKYKQYQQEYENALSPKCQQGFKCNEPCVWTGKRALERIV